LRLQPVPQPTTTVLVASVNEHVNTRYEPFDLEAEERRWAESALLFGDASMADKPFDHEVELRRWKERRMMFGDGQTADTPIDEAAEEARWVANKRYSDDSAEVATDICV
jgi:hypothetical protein